MGASGRGVEVLLDHHGGKSRAAAEIVHKALQKLAGVGYVLAPSGCSLHERIGCTGFYGLHIAMLLFDTLAAILAGAAGQAPGV